MATEDIVSGFPVGGGEYVIVTREELKEVAPGKSDLVDITEFVELSDIDPKYFRQTYYLAPRGKGADRAYALLHRTLRDMDKVAVGTLVMREQEHLVAIRARRSIDARDDVLQGRDPRSKRRASTTFPSSTTPARPSWTSPDVSSIR